MLVISKRIAPRDAHDVELVLPFELRQKSRLRTRLDSGEEIGLFLDRGQILRGGDYLQSEDGRVVKVCARPEKVLQIACDTAEALTRLVRATLGGEDDMVGAWHVGVSVGGGCGERADGIQIP